MKRAVGPLLLILLLIVAPLRGADYRIDSAHSHAEFGIRLLWVHQIHGHFADIHGEVTLNPLRDSVVVEATLNVDSVQMSSARLRRWVLDPEFFDARRYPTIHFTSAPLSVGSLDQGGALPGWLTLRGVTRPVRFQLEPADCTLRPGAICHIEVRGVIRRNEFGMNSHHTALSNDVALGLLITLQPATP